MKCVRLETFVLYFGICCIIITSILAALFFGLYVYLVYYALAGLCYDSYAIIWSTILFLILFEISTILLCLSIVLVIGIRKKRPALLKWYYLLGSILNIMGVIAIVFYIIWYKSEAYKTVYVILTMNTLYCVVLILVGRLHIKYRQTIQGPHGHGAIKFRSAANQYLLSNENPLIA